MSGFETFLGVIKKYHRQIIWITLGFLFFLDVITTTIGLQKGGYEQTPFMIPFVNNPVAHSIIKFIAFLLICIPIDKFLIYLYKMMIEESRITHKICYAITYVIVIVVLIWLILLFITINAHNIEFILSYD